VHQSIPNPAEFASHPVSIVSCSEVVPKTLKASRIQKGFNSPNFRETPRVPAPERLQETALQRLQVKRQLLKGFQETAPQRLQETAPQRLQETAPQRLQEPAPQRLQETTPQRLQRDSSTEASSDSSTEASKRQLLRGFKRQLRRGFKETAPQKLRVTAPQRLPRDSSSEASRDNFSEASRDNSAEASRDPTPSGLKRVQAPKSSSCTLNQLCRCMPVSKSKDNLFQFLFLSNTQICSTKTGITQGESTALRILLKKPLCMILAKSFTLMHNP